MRASCPEPPLKVSILKARNSSEADIQAELVTFTPPISFPPLTPQFRCNKKRNKLGFFSALPQGYMRGIRIVKNDANPIAINEPLINILHVVGFITPNAIIRNNIGKSR